jgi:hypothetical protein
MLNLLTAYRDIILLGRSVPHVHFHTSLVNTVSIVKDIAELVNGQSFISPTSPPYCIGPLYHLYSHQNSIAYQTCRGSNDLLAASLSSSQSPILDRNGGEREAFQVWDIAFVLALISC